ncbi:amino acid transmembrane transporter [Aureococcus anophagefferens]|nr:amino acid transmembrane transporter [Aureococcus anophagefferens]
MAEPKASFTQMFLMAVKLSIGAGALALPATLHACGVVEAIVLFLCMGGAVRWCMHAMLRAKDYCASRGVRVDAYPDLGSELIGGEVGRRGIEVSIVGFQLGVCCVYLEFAAELLSDVLPNRGRSDARGRAQWVVFLVPLVSAPCCLRHLRDLGDVAKVATAFFFAAWAAGQEKGDSTSLQRTLVQMANALSEPKRADELVRSAVTAVLAVYVVTAFLGGYAFDKPRNPLTLSVLDHEPGPPAVAVNVLVCVAVVLTYPLQFYPAIVALERIAGVGPGAGAPHGKRAKRRRPSGGGPDESDESDDDDADAEAAALLEGGRPVSAAADYGSSRLGDPDASVFITRADGGFPAVAFRLFFVAGTALVAVLVSDLTRLINLVGIIFAPMLAFIFPALCDLRVGDHVSGEYAALCSECHVFGHHAHKLVREAVAQGAAPSRRDWARTLDDHCANRRLATHAEDASQAMLCDGVLAGRHGAFVADALWDLVDGADGDGDDSTIASAAAVADALCAFDSVTEACPRNFRVHHAPTDTRGREKVFALARPAPRRGDAPDLEETTYRVKPRRGDCADGFDLYVDFTARFLQYAVEDRAAFDPAKPRSNANCPLNVTLAPDLMPCGTDVQPDGRPPHMRHSAIPKKHRRRKRREL